MPITIEDTKRPTTSCRKADISQWLVGKGKDRNLTSLIHRCLDVDARHFDQIRKVLALQRELIVLLKIVISGELIVKILQYIPILS